MNKSVAIAVGLQAFSCLGLLAQSNESTRPSEPVLKRAPSNAEWTILIYENREKTQAAVSEHGLEVPQGSDPADGPKEVRTQPKSITVSKSGNTYREITRWEDGRTREKWIEGDRQVYEAPFSGQLTRSGSVYSDDYSDYRRSDFEPLEWVSMENFQGIKDLKGRKVFEFRVDAGKRRLNARELAILGPDAPLKSTPGEGTETVTGGGASFTAYFDVQTQLPVYLDDGQTVRIYKFAERAPGNLVMPANFSAEFASWKKSGARPARPRP